MTAARRSPLRRAPGALLLGALGLLLALAAPPLRGAEFVTPAGLNVEAQESVLKEQVRQIARSLVGDALVDVVARVRYVRTDGGSGKRIKLPGVNSYITPSGTGSSEIVSSHARIRQVVVMINDGAEMAPDTLARELRQQAGLDPAKGDMVQVVKVAARKPGTAAGGAAAGAGQDDGLAEDTQALSERLRSEQERQKHERTSQELGKMIAQGTLAEAQSTTYLIKARQAYFNGDYERALDQILQSIAQNPNNPQAYAMLGSLYYAVDWKQLALKYWEKSLTLDPDNREIQDLVAQLRTSPQ